jgi:hypothetical protein
VRPTSIAAIGSWVRCAQLILEFCAAGIDALPDATRATQPHSVHASKAIDSAALATVNTMAPTCLQARSKEHSHRRRSTSAPTPFKGGFVVLSTWCWLERWRRDVTPVPAMRQSGEDRIAAFDYLPAAMWPACFAISLSIKACRVPSGFRCLHSPRRSAGSPLDL